MKTLRLILLLLAIGLTYNASAQGAKEKALQAEVREAYTKAQQLAEKGKQETAKNYQVFTSVTTDPNGRTERTVEFIFDNSEMEEHLEIFPLQLVMIREKIGEDVYKEFLFDKEDKLRFFFGKYTYEGQTTEERFYYGYTEESCEVYSIVKSIETSTGKVLKEEKKMEDIGENGNALFMGRVANDMRQGFECLNMMYD